MWTEATPNTAQITDRKTAIAFLAFAVFCFWQSHAKLFGRTPAKKPDDFNVFGKKVAVAKAVFRMVSSTGLWEQGSEQGRNL